MAVPESTTQLMVGRITAIGEKQIRVVKYGQPSTGVATNGSVYKSVGKLRYSHEAVLIDGPDILIYLMKFASNKQ